jgi:molybdate transport system substrate-binding protein
MFKAAVLGCLLCCASLVSAQEVITVAVASSYYEKAKVYSAQFEQKHDVTVHLVSGSTGRLYNQIKQGAPFDIWIAAGSQPIDLDKPHKAMGNGYLAVQFGKHFTTNLSQLTQGKVRKIAIANPQTAPFGAAAKQILQQQGLWQTLKPKLVYAQNAMQASMMVNQGLVDVAFVPVANGERYIATVPYVAVLLNDSVLARSFYQGLSNHTKPVIPAKAGIHQGDTFLRSVDSRLRGNDEYSP